MAEKPEGESSGHGRDRTTLDPIAKALRGLQFGELKLVVQDGIVVQVERTERIRLQRSGSKR